jgi:predicted MFS family arabinose efflux permease
MGILFGAVIGAVLNALFGYAIPFYIIGASFIFVLIPTIIYIPKDTQKIDK